MRVLLTGCHGNIGQTTINWLLQQGWDVIGLDRTSRDGKNEYKVLINDLASPTLVEEITSKVPPCDAIIHTAACIKQVSEYPDLVLSNCLGTYNMLKLAQKWESKKIIFISSIQVIGKPQYIPVTEEHPLQPLTAYHASKVFGENLCLIEENSKLHIVILRLSSPLGAGMSRDKIVPVFVTKALRGEPIELIGLGKRIQNYIDVRDIAVAIERCLMKDVSGIFNICGKKSISNLDLAHLCLKTLNSKSEICFSGLVDPEEGNNWEIDISKAKEKLGFVSKYSIEDSIKYLGEFYANSFSC